jgi:hypothetical protein
MVVRVQGLGYTIVLRGESLSFRIDVAKFGSPN